MTYRVDVVLPKGTDEFMYETYEQAMKQAIKYVDTFVKYGGCTAGIIPREGGYATFVLEKENYPTRFIDIRKEEAQ